MRMHSCFPLYNRTAATARFQSYSSQSLSSARPTLAPRYGCFFEAFRLDAATVRYTTPAGLSPVRLLRSSSYLRASPGRWLSSGSNASPPPQTTDPAFDSRRAAFYEEPYIRKKLQR